MTTIAKKLQSISWFRLGAESIAIIASILIAFAIDAWWEDRQVQEVRVALQFSLAEDFRTNVPEIQRVIEVVEAQVTRLNHFKSLHAAGDFSSTEELRVSLRPAFQLAEPRLIDSALDSAISDGKISLITTAEIRDAISRFIEARNEADSRLRFHAESIYLGPISKMSQEIGGIDVLFSQTKGIALSEEEFLDRIARKDILSIATTAIMLRQNYLRALRDLKTASEEVLAGMTNADD